MTQMQTVDESKVGHIVFLCLSALGDLMLSIPLIQATRSLYQNAQITIVCSRPVTADLARELQIADDVVLIPARARRSPIALLCSLQLMHSLKADIAFQTFASHGAFANLMLGATRARIRCGFSNGRFSGLLTHRIEIKDERHYIPLNLDLLRRLGHPEIADPTGCYLPPIENLSMKYPVAGLAEQYGRYIIISISSDPTLFFKRWPLKKWSELSRLLTQEGFTLLYVGSPADQADIATILQDKEIRGENLAGKTNFADLAALIQGSTLVVGTDGMILHFAAAMDKPCVGLFGPTNALREGPWRQMHRCISLIRPGFPCYSANTAKLPTHVQLEGCMDYLPVEPVYRRINEVLAEEKKQP